MLVRASRRENTFSLSTFNFSNKSKVHGARSGEYGQCLTVKIVFIQKISQKYQLITFALSCNKRQLISSWYSGEIRRIYLTSASKHQDKTQH